jgi:hypothetical protein
MLPEDRASKLNRLVQAGIATGAIKSDAASKDTASNQ